MEFLSLKFKSKYHAKDPFAKQSPLPKKTKRISILSEPSQPMPSALLASQEDSPKPPIEQVYNPFPLLPKSSFNPTSMTQKRLSNLHPIIKAKYAAYTRPDIDVEYEINKSEERSKAFLAEKMAKERIEKESIQKKFDILHRNQDPSTIAQGKFFFDIGLELSNQSKQRIKARKEKILNDRRIELLLIVEGQKNSIEAIKVIQYLMPRKKVILKVMKRLAR
jgi:hypothetical protein